MIKAIKSKILKGIKNKRINVFFLFLIMSFSVLILMKLSKTYTNTIDFKINKINIPESAVIFDDTDKKLQISLKSQGFNFLKYYFKNPKIDIDFSQNIKKSDKHFIWNKSSAYLDIVSQFKKSVEIVNIAPDTLLFKYDVNTIKKVPVRINANVSFGIGYDMSDSYKITPDSIKVIGPDALVSNIEYIETDTLKLQNINKDISTSVKLKIPKKNEFLRFTRDNVQVEATVAKFTEGDLKIPVTVINVPDNITLKYYPKKISVSYYTSLVNFKSITAADFEVTCDYAEVSKSQTFLIPRITKQPSAVKHVKINHDQIEYIITE
ncbi:CdaR family protein [Bizionia myxarmorum]|uniref:YbbR-like domain-containing protein n=1 Tax=Bizionia myxarmorum TaxID=291186 RepID=A0A5D0RFE3_9FLAO|nr:CdaR family protein [Bizionia myxarmorum]TYB79671.1 YbbR-like domain-containing protein [Bizionia myxarmorum]